MVDIENVLPQRSSDLDRASLHTFSARDANDQNGPRKTPLAQVTEVKSKDELEDGQSGRMNRVRRLSIKLKSKFHRTTDEISPANNDQRRSDKTILAPTLAPAPSPSINDERFTEKPPEKPSLPPAKEFLSKPLESAKSLAHIRGGNDLAENLAKTDISHGASVSLVRAHDKIGDATTADEHSSATDNFEHLKNARQDTYVRWTLDRHISKVGRIVPHRIPEKDRNDFIQKDEHGKSEMHWKEYGQYLFLFQLDRYAGQYIGASSDLPDPTEKALMASFERVLMTSTPLQNLVMKLRHIADWDDPLESGIYLVIYCTLMFYNYIPRAIILLAIFTVLRRRFFPPSIEDLEKDLRRTEDLESTSQGINELIDSYGTHGWIDPLIEQAGPNMLSNLEDLANAFEILRNFYEWRDPKRTAVSLTIIFLLWIIISLTPLHILEQGSFFAMGVIFFVLTPLATRFPRYKVLTSPLIWLFWKVPTHAEWAIARIQAEATLNLETIRRGEHLDKNNVSGTADSSELRNYLPSSPKEAPNSFTTKTNSKDQARPSPLRIGRYHCTSGKSHGNLCISTDRVSFESHLTTTEKWSVKYDELESMDKAAGTGTLRSGGDLRFVKSNGEEYTASGLKVRDEVFSQIIGYSDVRWQKKG